MRGWSEGAVGFESLNWLLDGAADGESSLEMFESGLTGESSTYAAAGATYFAAGATYVAAGVAFSTGAGAGVVGAGAGIAGASARFPAAAYREASSGEECHALKEAAPPATITRTSPSLRTTSYE